MHLETISNGMGAPSMYMLTLAAKGIIPARVSITADTGSELDCDFSEGGKIEARVFFDQVIKPYCDRNGIDAYFVRAVDKDKNPLPPLWEVVKRSAADFAANPQLKNPRSMFVPLFGSNGGRLGQSCTDKWKKRALRQQARRLGADTSRAAQGIHYDERERRVKGDYTDLWSDWTTYWDIDRWQEEDDIVEQGSLFGAPTELNIGQRRPVVSKSFCHYYPLVDLKRSRRHVEDELRHERLPWIAWSQCDGCPHQDLWRWRRRSPWVIDEVLDVEDQLGGNFYFSDERERIDKAMELKLERAIAQGIFLKEDSGFNCTDGLCGV